MSLVLQSSGGGQITVQEPTTASNFTQTLPAATGTIANTNQLGNGFRNRIINGQMTIDQRNAGASVTPTDAYTLDRWEVREDTDGAASAQQISDAPTGFSNSTIITTTTADASLTGVQRVLFSQYIEGFNTSDLNFGTANAVTVTLSFWVKSTLTGTFAGSLQNSARNRSYVFNYTISAANTWEQKSITITGDTTGTWIGATNGIGLRVNFALGVGPDNTGTANSWQGSNLFSSSGATSVIGTLSATWQVTGVQLELGSTATPFDFRSIGTELALCQRYYHKWVGAIARKWMQNGMILSTTNSYAIYYLKVTMRADPTLTTTGTASDYCLYAGNSLFICNAVPTLNTSSVDTPNLSWTSTGMTDGRASLNGSNTDNMFIGFNAEL